MKSMLDWKAAAWAGVSAGVIFMMLEMLLVHFAGPGTMWGPPRMIAAIVMGPGVLPPPETFDPIILVVAMLVHFALSLVYGFVFGAIASYFGFGTSAATGVGVLFGLALYLVNFYGFTAAFPWFAEARNWISILSHLVYGGTLGYAYAKLARPSGSPQQVRANEGSAPAAPPRR